MRVTVKPFMNIKKIMGDNPETDIEIESGTLRSLMEKLFNIYGEELRNVILDQETKEINKFYHIILNSQSYANLPKGLDTELKDGDVVALFPPVGGG